MNRSAFEHGLRCELEKLSLETRIPGHDGSAPIASPAPVAPATAGGESNTPSGLQRFATGWATGAGRIGNAATQSSFVPTSWKNPLTYNPVSLTAKMFGAVDNKIKGGITDGVNAVGPGKVVTPSGSWGQAMRDSVAADSHYLGYAKDQAANRSQQLARETPVTELTGLRDKMQLPQDELGQQVGQHVAHDPTNIQSLSKIVGDKTYGAFGVGDGLEGKLTPGNFQFGNFVNDHWGKLLGAGGLLAALMYALKGNGNDEQHQQGPVINNYMGGQPQFSRMPGYGQ